MKKKEYSRTFFYIPELLKKNNNKYTFVKNLVKVYLTKKRKYIFVTEHILTIQ